MRGFNSVYSIGSRCFVIAGILGLGCFHGHSPVSLNGRQNRTAERTIFLASNDRVSNSTGPGTATDCIVQRLLIRKIRRSTDCENKCLLVNTINGQRVFDILGSQIYIRLRSRRLHRNNTGSLYRNLAVGRIDIRHIGCYTIKRLCADRVGNVLRTGRYLGMYLAGSPVDGLRSLSKTDDSSGTIDCQGIGRRGTISILGFGHGSFHSDNTGALHRNHTCRINFGNVVVLVIQFLRLNGIHNIIRTGCNIFKCKTILIGDGFRCRLRKRKNRSSILRSNGVTGRCRRIDCRLLHGSRNSNRASLQERNLAAFAHGSNGVIGRCIGNLTGQFCTIVQRVGGFGTSFIGKGEFHFTLSKRKYHRLQTNAHRIRSRGLGVMVACRHGGRDGDGTFFKKSYSTGTIHRGNTLIRRPIGHRLRFVRRIRCIHRISKSGVDFLLTDLGHRKRHCRTFGLGDGSRHFLGDACISICCQLHIYLQLTHLLNGGDSVRIGHTICAVLSRDSIPQRHSHSIMAIPIVGSSIGPDGVHRFRDFHRRGFLAFTGGITGSICHRHHAEQQHKYQTQRQQTFNKPHVISHSWFLLSSSFDLSTLLFYIHLKSLQFFITVLEILAEQTVPSALFTHHYLNPSTAKKRKGSFEPFRFPNSILFRYNRAGNNYLLICHCPVPSLHQWHGERSR